MTFYEGAKRRMILLTGGLLGIFSSKTAVSILRYCADEVVGVIDAKHAGGDLAAIVGIGAGVPIFATVGEALAAKPDSLVIGVAPMGGRLEPLWRSECLEALKNGLDVIAGLHTPLAGDAELAAAAKASGARIFDVRMSPDSLPVSTMKAMDVNAYRVLTVGTDCSSGKMIAALELTKAARVAGLDGRFIATGQSGIMIAGKGIAIDHVISDFTAGAVEKMIVEDGDADVLFVEGQGSLVHPGYSGVTLGLMHGALPNAMVMVHDASRRNVRSYPREVKLPGLKAMVELTETVMRPVFASKVIAISLNTATMSEDDARCAVEDAQNETGLPAGDVVRFGAEPVWNAVKEAYDEAANRNAQTHPSPSV